ncbi:MAG: beta-propeller fold lactonase family protein [Candidatus Goldbacteria bacterium]|nr:beta-propeller fold lactonase family protein [Candidatus Goldiibacteriota bacterium]
MTLYALLAFFMLLAGYCFFMKNNYRTFILLLFKMLVLCFLLNVKEPVYIVCLFFAFCIVYVLVLMPVKIVKRNRKEYVLFLLAIVFVFLFSGCSKKISKPPQIEINYKLNFIPSDVCVLNNEKILVGAEREKKIAIVNLNTGKINKIINSGANPVDILVKGNYVYSANKSSSDVTIHNLSDNETTNIPSGGQNPSALALNGEKKLLYVANTGSSNISIIDIQGKRIKSKINTEKWPADILITNDNKYLYVPCKYTNVIQLIDAEKERCLFTKIDAGISPAQLLKLNKRQIAIINEWEYSFNQQSTINVFDTKDYAIKYNIRVDGGIFRGALSRSKKYLYLTVPAKDKIIFVDVKKRSKIFEITKKDTAPKYIAVSPDGTDVFVSCQTSKEILRIKVNDLL